MLKLCCLIRKRLEHTVGVLQVGERKEMTSSFSGIGCITGLRIYSCYNTILISINILINQTLRGKSHEQKPKPRILPHSAEKRVPRVRRDIRRASRVVHIRVPALLRETSRVTLEPLVQGYFFYEPRLVCTLKCKK